MKEGRGRLHLAGSERVPGNDTGRGGTRRFQLLLVVSVALYVGRARELACVCKSRERGERGINPGGKRKNPRKNPKTARLPLSNTIYPPTRTGAAAASSLTAAAGSHGGRPRCHCRGKPQPFFTTTSPPPAPIPSYLPSFLPLLPLPTQAMCMS